MFELRHDDRLALLQSLKTCMILHDAKTRDIVWANAAACNALGFTVEELLPLKAPDMSRNEAKYRHEIGIKWLEEAAEKGESIIEWCYRAKDGTEILSEAVATRVTLQERDVLMVQFRDIAAEERIKRDLKRFETRVKEFMQDLVEGIAVLGAAGEVKYLSESSRRVLGLAEDSPAPTNFAALCDDASRGTLLAHLHAARVAAMSSVPGLADVSDVPGATSAPGMPGMPGVSDAHGAPDTPALLRYRIRHPDGTLRWHDASCRHVELEDDLSGVLLHFRDVTAQVEAEEMRRVSERKIEYLARYNAMGEMAMTLSHELSQPLASARNFLEGGMLRLKAVPAAQGEIMWGLESVLRQVERASVVVKSVRDYVVKVEQAEEETDLNAIVRDVEYFITLRARDAGVRFDAQLDRQPLRIRCEKILIGQVILNFAFNAIEAMLDMPAPQRLISLYTGAEQGRAVLRVADTGPGIDIGRQQKAFDGFFTSKIGGNGIGLSLCRNIIARHGGDVWVEPNAPHGASFCFSLPQRQHLADQRGDR